MGFLVWDLDDRRCRRHGVLLAYECLMLARQVNRHISDSCRRMRERTAPHSVEGSTHCRKVLLWEQLWLLAWSDKPLTYATQRKAIEHLHYFRIRFSTHFGHIHHYHDLTRQVPSAWLVIPSFVVFDQTLALSPNSVRQAWLEHCAGSSLTCQTSLHCT